ncbi:hypothetical protein AHAS_Ahas07G0139700 [Arachis hypogaea]
MNIAWFIKRVTIADGGLEKTCILIACTRNTFSTDYVRTVFDNFSENVVVDGSTVNFGLQDNTGNYFSNVHT